MLKLTDVHPSVFQKFVGDSTISVVMDVYTHVNDEKIEIAK